MDYCKTYIMFIYGTFDVILKKFKNGHLKQCKIVKNIKRFSSQTIKNWN